GPVTVCSWSVWSTSPPARSGSQYSLRASNNTPWHSAAAMTGERIRLARLWWNKEAATLHSTAEPSLPNWAPSWVRVRSTSAASAPGDSPPGSPSVPRQRRSRPHVPSCTVNIMLIRPTSASTVAIVLLFVDTGPFQRSYRKASIGHRTGHARTRPIIATSGSARATGPEVQGAQPVGSGSRALSGSSLSWAPSSEGGWFRWYLCFWWFAFGVRCRSTHNSARSGGRRLEVCPTTARGGGHGGRTDRCSTCTVPPHNRRRGTVSKMGNSLRGIDR